MNSPALSVFHPNDSFSATHSCPGVAFYKRLPGVIPLVAGVSDPLERAGFSSQRTIAGVATSHVFFFIGGTVGTATGFAAGQQRLH